MQSNTLLKKISSLELICYPSSQSEKTITTEFYKTSEKVFSAAELWEYQRQRKNFTREVLSLKQVYDV